MNQKIYKILFILLVLSLFWASVEISFTISILTILLSISEKTSKPLVNLAVLLVAITSIGIFGIFFKGYELKDIFKDLIYFIRPIAVIFASYFLVKRINDKSYFINSVIILGFVFALIHLFKLSINVTRLTDTSTLRNYGGRYNHVELVALVFLTIPKTLRSNLPIKGLTLSILKAILVISFVMYLSRVMIVVYVLYFMSFKGYFMITKKGLKRFLIGVVSITAFLVVINQFNVNSNSEGIGGFIFKIQNTYNEMFESIDIEQIKRDRRDLWKHWRGFEAQSAIETLNSHGYASWIFGRGFGSLLDLGLEVSLDNQKTRYIPILHNGFAYLIFKTGLLGLFLYLLYIIVLYFNYKAKSNSMQIWEINRLICGTGLYVLMSTLVITGIFKPYDMSGLIIGGLFALRDFYNENSNIRN